MPQPAKMVEALCFHVVRPSVCPCVRSSVYEYDNFNKPLGEFHQIYNLCIWGKDELIRF